MADCNFTGPSIARARLVAGKAAPTFSDLQQKAMEAGHLLNAIDKFLQDTDADIWDAIWVARNCKRIVDELNEALDSVNVGKSIAASEAA